LFRQERVLHTHAADLVVVGDTLCACELADDLGLLGGLDVLVGCVVVRHEGDLGGIPHALNADLRELADGDRSRDVVGEHDIEAALDKLAGQTSSRPA